jgi:hypothetical protein
MAVASSAVTCALALTVHIATSATAITAIVCFIVFMVGFSLLYLGLAQLGFSKYFPHQHSWYTKKKNQLQVKSARF